jgi:hypothetical protein
MPETEQAYGTLRAIANGDVTAPEAMRAELEALLRERDELHQAERWSRAVPLTVRLNVQVAPDLDDPVRAGLDVAALVRSLRSELAGG